MKEYQYIIIGGGLAGQRGAQGIRKIDTNGTVALVTAESHSPYERPPLSKGYLVGEEGLDAVILKGEDWYNQNEIEIMAGTRAIGVDSGARTVTVDDGRTRHRELSYTKLLLATGGHPWRLPLDGADLDAVYTLRAIEDSDAIRASAQDADAALVLGGSFIGSEVAASLTQMGVDVTMVFPGSRLLERVVPKTFSDLLHDMFEREGVRILSGNKPERFEGDGSVERVMLLNGKVLKVDMVVMGVGIRLNTELAKDAGLTLTDKGEVIVDEYLCTSDPDIYAVGDIAAWPDPTFQRRLRVEHWDVARRQGLRAGRNMAGAAQGLEQKPYTSLPYFFSDMFDLSFEVWGDLTSWDATILRGNMGSLSYQLFYFDQSELVGVLTVGRLGDLRKAIPKLIKADLAYDDLSDKLSDDAFDLTTLVQ
jgi:NADPH-dependent 2,4-dienoyl-CoA reductase/sulfur reductase-like enzyme